MKHLKTLGVVFIAILALSGIASATASAAEPEFNPGKEKSTFTIEGGTGKLVVEGQLPIECTKTSGSGEIVGTNKKEANATLTFTGCTAFGFIGAHSLDTKTEGTINTKVHLLLCFIKKGSPLEVGVLTKLTAPVHVEVAGKLIIVEGDQVGKITPIGKATKVFTIEYKQSGAKAEPKGCEGEEENYSAKINEEGAVLKAAEEATAKATFAVEQTLLG